MNDLILYTTDDGRSQIKLRAKDQPVWLTQREMATALWAHGARAALPSEQALSLPARLRTS